MLTFFRNRPKKVKSPSYRHWRQIQFEGEPYGESVLDRGTFIPTKGLLNAEVAGTSKTFGGWLRLHVGGRKADYGIKTRRTI